MSEETAFIPKIRIYKKWTIKRSEIKRLGFEIEMPLQVTGIKKKGDIRLVNDNIEIFMGNDCLLTVPSGDTRLKFLLSSLARAVTTFTGKSLNFANSTSSFTNTKTLHIPSDTHITKQYTKTIVEKKLKNAIKMDLRLETLSEQFIKSFYGKTSIDALKSNFKSMEILSGCVKTRSKFIQIWIKDVHSNDNTLFQSLVNELKTHLEKLNLSPLSMNNINNSNYTFTSLITKINSSSIDNQVEGLYQLIKTIRDDQEHRDYPDAKNRFTYFNNDGSIIIQIMSRILLLAYLHYIETQIENIVW